MSFFLLQEGGGKVNGFPVDHPVVFKPHPCVEVAFPFIHPEDPRPPAHFAVWVVGAGMAAITEGNAVQISDVIVVVVVPHKYAHDISLFEKSREEALIDR